MSGDSMKDEKTVPGGKKITLLSLVILQMGVILYTGSGICSKMAGSSDSFSLRWMFWVGMEVCCLGAYAIFWQQIIKHFDLSIAYANRAFAIFWSTLWAVLLFGEKITPANTLGIIVIFAGIMLVNSDAK